MQVPKLFVDVYTQPGGNLELLNEEFCQRQQALHVIDQYSHPEQWDDPIGFPDHELSHLWE